MPRRIVTTTSNPYSSLFICVMVAELKFPGTLYLPGLALKAPVFLHSGRAANLPTWLALNCVPSRSTYDIPKTIFYPLQGD